MICELKCDERTLELLKRSKFEIGMDKFCYNNTIKINKLTDLIDIILLTNSSLIIDDSMYYDLLIEILV